LGRLLNESVLVAIVEAINDCRDPKDNEFLELAVSGGATHLITGDDDLLVLHPFRDVAIVTPQTFLDEFSPPPSEALDCAAPNSGRRDSLPQRTNDGANSKLAPSLLVTDSNFTVPTTPQC
jgi:hypothetical protein